MPQIPQASFDLSRRRLVGLAATALVAEPLGLIGSAAGQSSGVAPGPIRQVEAGDLRVAYVEAGPVTGRPVILLHGWPYDVHAFDEVAPLLASAGYRVIMPWLRGYGATRFRFDATPRNGQQAVIAVDVIALMDALRIPKAIVAGFDWGARTANIVAALWPERVEGMVSVSGYLIGSQAANARPLPPAAEQSWWYQFYFEPSAVARVTTRTAGRSTG